MKEIELPPLPEMSYLGDDASYGYDNCDMREYARAAVEADRAQRVPECRVVDVGFRFDGEAQQHVPSIKVEFEPVPVNVGSGGKGWKDRDALAALLASTPAQPAPQPVERKPMTDELLAREAGASRKGMR